MVGFYPSNADLAIATGILYPFKELYETNLAEEFPAFTKWLNIVSQDFNLDKMPQDFVTFEPEEANSQIDVAEGTVDRENRISAAR